jgi:rhodanese-related sulfurtransferase
VEPSLLKFVQNNLLLFAVALVSGAMLLWPVVRRSAGGPSVSTGQATQLINREYDAGHILGAKSVPVSRIQSGTLPGDVAKRKEKPIIVYCETGNRSSAAASALRKQGFSRVHNLSGGISAWRQAGLPVEKK